MGQVLYKLPNGWEWQTLSETTLNAKADIVDGPFGSNLKASEYVSEGVPILRLQNVDRLNFINKNIQFITKEKAEQLSRHSYKVGDIVITKLGAPLGKACIVPDDFEDGRIVADIVRARINEDAFDKRYICYAINSSVCVRQLESQTKGATRPRVNLSHMRGLILPVAPIAEQKRIVEKLDALLTRIDTTIEHLRESVTLADALFESSQSEIFNDVLSNYQYSTIDEICIVTSSKRIFKADYVESGIPFYRTKEIVDLSKEKNISTELFIAKEKFSEICGKFGAPKKGDLLFSAVGTIGVMWIVDEREFYFKDGNLLWLKDMNGVTPEYLKSAINAVLTEKIKDRSQGAAYKAISITNLKAFEIPLPSIEEQKSIVAKIEYVSSVTKKTKQELSLQINNLQKLKASILDSAFKGEI